MNEVVSFGYLHKGIDSIQSFGADPAQGNDGQTRVFTFDAREGERYSLEIIGSDGVDPWIGTRSGETNYYSNGSGNRAKIEFTAEGGQGSGLYYTTVGAANPGEFTIKLSSVGDDHSAGPSTTSRINEGNPVIGNAETGDDIDWFRAALTKGDFYKVELKRHENEDSLGTPLLIVRNPESGIVDVSFVPPPLTSSSDGSSQRGEGPEVLFQAGSTGDHYFIARSKATDISGFYQLSYERVRAPITRKFQSEEFEEYSLNRFEFTDSQGKPLSRFFSAPTQATEIQVYSSTVKFKNHNTEQPLGTILSFQPSDLDSWSARAAEYGTHEIMIRAQTGGKWSEWLKTPILNRTPEVSLVSGSLWLESPINFHFSETLPSYFGNTYDGFQSIDLVFQQNNLASSLRGKPWTFPQLVLTWVTKMHRSRYSSLTMSMAITTLSPQATCREATLF